MTDGLDLYGALWRHRYMILLLTLVATAVAYLQSSAEPKVYRASTLIRVQQPTSATDPQQLGDALGVAQHLAQTYAQIIATDAIASKVSARIGAAARRSGIHITGEPVQDLELLYVRATSRAPDIAASAANATPVVLRQFLAAAGGPRDRIITINPARTPTTAISPRPGRAAFVAFAIALILNCGLALLFEFLRDRLPDADQVEETLGKPVLAMIPTLSLKQGSVRAQPIRDTSGLMRRSTGEKA